MSTIDRTKYNALIDDDGSGMVGTPWNKARIKEVILDPGDLAWGRGMTLVKAKTALDTTVAYHSLDTINFTGLTEAEAVILIYQFQVTSQPVSVSIWKGATSLADLVAPLAPNMIAMGTARVRQGAMQPTIAATLVESVIYNTNARRDLATWVATGEAFTAPWTLSINCAGVPAGGSLYYSYAAYRLAGA